MTRHRVLAPYVLLSIARLASSLVASACLLPLLAPASAEAQGVVLEEPSANRFYASPGGGFLMVDGSEVSGELQPYFGAMADYAHRPMTLDNVRALTGTGEPRNDDLDVVGGMTTLQLSGALALFDRVQIGLNVPIVLHTFGASYEWTEPGCNPPDCDPPTPMRIYRFRGGDGATVGDPRLHVLVNILDPDDASGFGFGIAGWATAPLARAILPGRYAGDPNFAAGGHLIFSFRVEHFRTAINLGGAYHQNAEITLREDYEGSARTPEMTWGAAAQYDFDEIWGVLAEIAGATTFGLVYDNEAPTELRAAAVARLGDFNVRLGAGAGLAYAIGVPIFRVLGDISYAPRPSHDTDGDGFRDDVDLCPAEDEDLDGNADDDGCPEPDNDEDGLPDGTDMCPDEAEDRDEVRDDDGCPDPDDDGDGINDGYDSCPQQAEDRDGDRDDDGCPDTDRDRDGIADDVDRCPTEPEDTDGLGDEDGCPDVDFDQDGIADTEDECPEEAEDIDGFEDGNGCPEEASPPPVRPRPRGR
ncbi:MAG: thrombospondin type 3 repeat-containing protein [Deltaproteobacteria bacterium]|jgi:hypothetical protein